MAKGLAVKLSRTNAIVATLPDGKTITITLAADIRNGRPTRLILEADKSIVFRRHPVQRNTLGEVRILEDGKRGQQK